VVNGARDATVGFPRGDEGVGEEKRCVEKRFRVRFCEPLSLPALEQCLGSRCGQRVLGRVTRGDTKVAHGFDRRRHRVIEDDDRLDDLSSRKLTDRGPSAFVGAFGKDDAANRRGRARLNVREKAQCEFDRERSASATAGWTRFDTSPP